MVSKCSVRNPGLTRFRYRKLRSIKPAPHNKSSARPLRRPQGRFVAAGLAHPARRLAGVPKRALGLRPRCFERGDGADEMEERRVGKECRYRWSRYQYKKNSKKTTKA